MVRKCYDAHRVQPAFAARDQDITELTVKETEWRVMYNVSRFLEDGASTFENQSGSTHKKLRLTLRIMGELMAGCRNQL